MLRYWQSSPELVLLVHWSAALHGPDTSVAWVCRVDRHCVYVPLGDNCEGDGDKLRLCDNGQLRDGVCGAKPVGGLRL